MDEDSTRSLTAPDPALLSAAASPIKEMLGLSDGEEITWRIGARLDRPRSSIFPLTATATSGTTVSAFYKVSHAPPYDAERKERWETVVRSGLARSVEMESRLGPLVENEGIAISRALAVDPASLSVVTLAVPGSAMKRVWRYALSPGGHRRAGGILRLAGRAARLIEECSPDSIAIDHRSSSAVIERRLERVRSILPSATLEAVERKLHELDRELMNGPRPMVFCHGDFSASNLLIDEGRIGLIDFTWPLRQRGFDLAHFAFRLEYDTAAPPSMTAPLIHALIEGYGAPSVTGWPGYRFVRLSKLLKVVEDGQRSRTGVGSGRARRARSEIESAL